MPERPTGGLTRVLGSVLDNLHAAEQALDGDAPSDARLFVSMAIGRVCAAAEFLAEAPDERSAR